MQIWATNCIVSTWLFLGGAGGSLRSGVTDNPIRLTRAVKQALVNVTCGGAPAYVWPGGGITVMVDVMRMPAQSFGTVPTPAIVAPIEFSMRLADYQALGGHMGSVRTSMMPDLPNIGETIPGYALDSWMGVMGPAGMPRAVVDRLNAEFNRLIRDPAFGREKLTPNGIDPLGTTPERMQEQLAADIDKYARIAQSAGIKPE